MILSRKQRLAALEDESNRLRIRCKPSFVLYLTEAITTEQQAALDAARRDGRTILIIRGTPFVPDPPSLLTDIVEVPDFEREANREPDMTKIQRPDAWGR